MYCMMYFIVFVSYVNSCRLGGVGVTIGCVCVSFSFRPTSHAINTSVRFQHPTCTLASLHLPVIKDIFAGLTKLNLSPTASGIFSLLPTLLLAKARACLGGSPLSGPICGIILIAGDGVLGALMYVLT